jgi:hypothetical protein
MLIEHYAEHKAANSRISFFDFLYMHYAGDDFNDQDQDRDNQLPFKSHNVAQPDIQFVPLHFQAGVLNIHRSSMENLATDAQLDFQSSYLSSIWQPPKA